MDTQHPEMDDVQNQHDGRNIPINQVGVKDLRYPITVLDLAHNHQHTVATIQMSVNLPHQFKGTHMSRFLEVLNAHRGEITMRTLPHMLGAMKRRLEAVSARIVLSFPYFIERRAPLSNATGLMDYQCTFVGESNGNKEDFILGVVVPVTSLCPCSKAISDYGAHNQRGQISIEVRSCRNKEGQPDFVWIEEMVEVAERSASAPVYPVLKREDERHVTMQAYDNPVFVEDVVRNVAQLLMEDDRVSWFQVEAVNQESIHNHAAFARIEWKRETAEAHKG